MQIARANLALAVGLMVLLMVTRLLPAAAAPGVSVAPADRRFADGDDPPPGGQTSGRGRVERRGKEVKPVLKKRRT
jgi:hypothetical protein